MRSVGRGTAILLVACGGEAGAVARFLVGDSFSRRFGTGWPYGTLFINVTGCFAIALFLSAAASRAQMSLAWRYLFPVGFVGAYGASGRIHRRAVWRSADEPITVVANVQWHEAFL